MVLGALFNLMMAFILTISYCRAQRKQLFLENIHQWIAKITATFNQPGPVTNSETHLSIVDRLQADMSTPMSYVHIYDHGLSKR